MKADLLGPLPVLPPTCPPPAHRRTPHPGPPVQITLALGAFLPRLSLGSHSPDSQSHLGWQRPSC